MKLRKSVQTIYIRKDALQTKSAKLHSGEVYVRTTWRPNVIRRPRGWKGKWDNHAGVWVEFKAMRTFVVREKRTISR